MQLTPYNLATIWCNGDLPFRPRWLAKLFVLRLVQHDSVRACQIVLMLQSHGPGVAETFVTHLAIYRADPWRWRFHEVVPHAYTLPLPA